MKRHPALIPLSHDHQHGLAAALRLKRSANAWVATPADTNQELCAVATEFVEFARRDLAPHFEEEERALLPLLANPDLNLAAAGDQFAAEHAALRVAIRRLEAALGDAGRGLAASGEELQAAAADAATMLHDHIRWEERDLFEHVQQAVTSAELDRLQLPPRQDPMTQHLPER